MRYQAFEQVMSQTRMSRYLAAVGGDSRKSMTLYRLNLRLSQELFTVVSCFEIALRNAINEHYRLIHGNDWLRDSVQIGGIFYNGRFRFTAGVINDALQTLSTSYTHAKVVAELGFGFWRYMFATHQFRAAGQNLLQIFPNKPSSTPQVQYNSNYVFGRFERINKLRNRLAHHEPICFQIGHPVIDTSHATNNYQLILAQFNWLDIDEKGLLYGLDHVDEIITRINNL